MRPTDRPTERAEGARVLATSRPRAFDREGLALADREGLALADREGLALALAEVDREGLALADREGLALALASPSASDRIAERRYAIVTPIGHRRMTMEVTSDRLTAVGGEGAREREGTREKARFLYLRENARFLSEKNFEKTETIDSKYAIMSPMTKTSKQATSTATGDTKASARSTHTKGETMTFTMTNEAADQVAKVTTDIEGTTTIEVWNVDHDGNDILVGTKHFDHTPSGMSDLDIMCQEVDGYRPDDLEG